MQWRERRIYTKVDSGLKMPKLIEFLLVYAWVWVWVCSTIKTEQFNRTFMIWAAKVFWLTLFTVYGALHFGIVHGSFFFSSSSSPYRMHRNTPLDKYIIEKEIIKRKECIQANNWTHTHTHTNTKHWAPAHNNEWTHTHFTTCVFIWHIWFCATLRMQFQFGFGEICWIFVHW